MSTIDPGVFLDLATGILENGGQRASASSLAAPAKKEEKARPISEMSEEEQLQMAMNQSLADDPIVIDDTPVAAEETDCIHHMIYLMRVF